MNIVELPLRNIPPELVARFAAIVGERYAITDPAEIAPYLTEERGLYHGRSPLVLRPGSVAEVAAILRLANETNTPIVPQGGNTGLVGGQTPHQGEALMSLRRLDRIREGDPTSNRMTCEAGRALVKHPDLPGARRSHQGTGGRGRRRPPLSALARRRRQLHHRRQPLDQCRRHGRARLWGRARTCTRA